jgi:hypothetical protein
MCPDIRALTLISIPESFSPCLRAKLPHKTSRPFTKAHHNRFYGPLWIACEFIGAVGAVGAVGARRFGVLLVIKCMYTIIHSYFKEEERICHRRHPYTIYIQIIVLMKVFPRIVSRECLVTTCGRQPGAHRLICCCNSIGCACVVICSRVKRRGFQCNE